MESLNASSDALVSPTTIHDDRVHKRDSPKWTEKKSLPPTPPGKAKKAPADTGASGEAVTTPSKGRSISQAPTAESTESTNSADPVSNSTPQPRAPSERKQSKRSYTSNDDFDPMDCNRNGAEWHNQWWMCGFGETIRDVLKGRREPGKKPTSRSKSPKAAEIMKARRGEC